MKNEDVEELIAKIKKDFNSLSTTANDALTDDEIEKLSAIDIKQIAENIRSALDYIAVDIIKSTKLQNIKKIYFPYGSSIQKLESINKWMPELKKINQNLYQSLIKYQDFNLPDSEKWIIQLCNLSVKVKHNELERPARNEDGKTTKIANIFQVDGTSTVKIGNLTYYDENGAMGNAKNINITPSTKTRDLKEKFDGTNIQSSITFKSVSFLTSSGCDIIKILNNSIHYLQLIYQEIYSAM
ncbi:MAG: hypothetical protein E7I51_08615 [Raoultella sp.]|nr:hypothetical protein [Raoultella sp.]